MSEKSNFEQLTPDVSCPMIIGRLSDEGLWEEGLNSLKELILGLRNHYVPRSGVLEISVPGIPQKDSGSVWVGFFLIGPPLDSEQLTEDTFFVHRSEMARTQSPLTEVRWIPRTDSHPDSVDPISLERGSLKWHCALGRDSGKAQELIIDFEEGFKSFQIVG